MSDSEFYMSHETSFGKTYRFSMLPNGCHDIQNNTRYYTASIVNGKIASMYFCTDDDNMPEAHVRDMQFIYQEEHAILVTPIDVCSVGDTYFDYYYPGRTTKFRVIHKDGKMVELIPIVRLN